VYSCRWLPTFRKDVSSHSSELMCVLGIAGYDYFNSLKMEAIRSSEELVTAYKTTWRHNPEDHSRHFQFISYTRVSQMKTVKLR
jgi:hypothetical protein